LDRRAWTVLQRARARLPHSPPPVILSYHRIAQEPFDPWGLSVSPEHFNEHLTWITRNRTVLRLVDFAELHRSGALPPGAVAITFDDGYACNGIVAAPLLDSFRTPATCFLSTGFLSGSQFFWWDELQEIILAHEGTSLNINGEEVLLGERRPGDRHWSPWAPAHSPRQRAYEQVQAQLARGPYAELEAAMAELRRQTTSVGVEAPLKRPMTASEIRIAARAGMEFGAHGVTHPWLPQLEFSEQRREIVESAEQCQQLSGSPALTFAYPFGMYDARSELAVEEAGFRCACTTGDRAVSRRSRQFALPRLQVGNWSAATLERVLARVAAA
jgi:peptidoglycan/xylan/chitin deacetylase (PgdA/CDA1 family)